MALRKQVMITLVLVAFSGLLFGCSNDSSTVIDPTPATEAPILAPANVTVSTLGNGDIEVSWTANTQAHLRGYNVYRLDLSNSEIGTLASETDLTSYTDGNTEWRHTYIYSVTSVSARGTESAASTATFSVGDRGLGHGHDNDYEDGVR